MKMKVALSNPKALNAAGPLMSCAACGFTDIEIHPDQIITSAQANNIKTTPRLSLFTVVELTDYLLDLHEFSRERYELFKKTPVEYQAGFTCYKKSDLDRFKKLNSSPATVSPKDHPLTPTHKTEDGMDFTSETVTSDDVYEEKLYNLHAHCIPFDINDNKVYACFCKSCHEAHQKVQTYKYAVTNGHNLPALLQSAADIAKLRILLKIKSYFDPAFDSKFLNKANKITQVKLDNAVQDVINNALVSEVSAAITAAIDAHATDLNDSSEEQVQSDEDGATLTSALVSNLNDAIPANMKDVFGAMFKDAPIEDSNEGEGEWLDSSDEEMDKKLKPAKITKPLDIALDMAGMGTLSSATKKPIPSGKLPQVQISIGNSLMNEFEDMHRFYMGSCPSNFYLHKESSLLLQEQQHVSRNQTCYMPHINLMLLLKMT
ncbi:hypothetical protein HDU80_011303 [Chytriomyces hyalinus]|nr:hypothetical protein HDU80_011303 [Chytriomyces hyalinus]